MDGVQRTILEEMNWADFTTAAVLSPAGASLTQAFSQVGAIKQENSADWADFVFSRLAFVESFVTNTTRLPTRIITTMVALAISICDEGEVTNHFMRQLSSLAATVAAIVLSIMGMISPEEAFNGYLEGVAHFSGGTILSSLSLRASGAAVVAAAIATESANLVYLATRTATR